MSQTCAFGADWHPARKRTLPIAALSQTWPFGEAAKAPAPDIETAPVTRHLRTLKLASWRRTGCGRSALPSVPRSGALSEHDQFFAQLIGGEGDYAPSIMLTALD